ARAFALGDARCDQEQGRNRRLADQRYRRNPAGRDQRAVSGSRARGPTRIRALGAGSATAHAHRLGGDPAPGAGGTFRRPRRAEAVSSGWRQVVAVRTTDVLSAETACRTFSTNSSAEAGRSFPSAGSAQPNRCREPGGPPTSLPPKRSSPWGEPSRRKKRGHMVLVACFPPVARSMSLCRTLGGKSQGMCEGPYNRAK